MSKWIKLLISCLITSAIILIGLTQVGKSKAVVENPINQHALLVADRIEVDKSERKLWLINNDVLFREYPIALGDSPEGHKAIEGDEKTPEGNYIIDWRNAKSIAHKSLHISYPNANDKAVAKKLGASPGGNIMIHGTLNGYENWEDMLSKRDWTDGCIAVKNRHMNEIWQSVKNGTKIQIKP